MERWRVIDILRYPHQNLGKLHIIVPEGQVEELGESHPKTAQIKPTEPTRVLEIGMSSRKMLLDFK